MFQISVTNMIINAVKRQQDHRRSIIAKQVYVIFLGSQFSCFFLIDLLYNT